jgi:gp16 family phage-associated protein
MRKSAKQVRGELIRRGMSISELARQLKVDRSLLVYVLNGGACRRGRAHDIAVKLLIKEGVLRAPIQLAA